MSYGYYELWEEIMKLKGDLFTELKLKKFGTDSHSMDHLTLINLMRST